MKMLVNPFQVGQCGKGTLCCTTSAPTECKFNQCTNAFARVHGERYTKRACNGTIVYDPAP
jgi:hypothetical protein